jgi:DNA repair exonuclease SbcCD ATPase subunit
MLAEKKNLLENSLRRRNEAQLRFEAAQSSTASIDLASLEQAVNSARMAANVAMAPPPEKALEDLQLARQNATQVETDVRVAQRGLSDARAKFESIAGFLGQPADEILADAEKKLEEANTGLKSLDDAHLAEVEAADREFQEAEKEVTSLLQELTERTAKAESAKQALAVARTRHNEARIKFEPLIQSAPTVVVSDAEDVLAQAREALQPLTNKAELNSSADQLQSAEELLWQEQSELQAIEKELQEAQGQLKLVGGIVAKEERDETRDALEVLKKSAVELEDDYRAEKHLFDVLKEANAKHTSHLGRSLAKPVSDLFHQFTGTRYAQVNLDPGLRVQTIAAMGNERELASLSVGTRDQFSTILRLALAAHLKSVLLLDDQLTHSDLQRLDWFRSKLRASVQNHDHQIVVITCRPLDYLRAEEMPVPPSDRFESADGKLTVVDLERAIVHGT